MTWLALVSSNYLFSRISALLVIFGVYVFGSNCSRETTIAYNWLIHLQPIRPNALPVIKDLLYAKIAIVIRANFIYILLVTGVSGFLEVRVMFRENRFLFFI
jgi:hypothetical protein